MMKGKWEAQTSVENKEAMDPFVISLEETQERENDADDWRVPLG
jgi:hypothetical protein